MAPQCLGLSHSLSRATSTCASQAAASPSRGQLDHFPLKASLCEGHADKPSSFTMLSLLPLLLLMQAAGPAAVNSAPVLTANISYGGPGGCQTCPSCQCLDVLQPAPTNAASPAPQAPVVLLLHGGLWYSGSRAEVAEVCHSLVTSHGITCAMADYRYSQDLGGCCNATDCPPTYRDQATEVVAAIARLRELGFTGPLYLGGHSAGGHLAVLLALEWGRFAAAQAAPEGYFGVEGIYNVSQWDEYDQQRWGSRFHCQTRQAFGLRPAGNWRAGSPTLVAPTSAPAGPVLLVHSRQDDWVQAAQAADLFPRLKPSPDGRAHSLDVNGSCAEGEHEDVLKGPSAVLLADCIARLADPRSG